MVGTRRAKQNPWSTRGSGGSGGEIRTLNQRINSPFQARSLTWANTEKHTLTWGFACSAVVGNLQQFSLNRVLRASWR